MDGIDIRRPWHVVPAIDPFEISQQIAADVVESVRAAGSQATRDAWRALACELTPDIALVIRTELDHVERTTWGAPPPPESEVDDAGTDPNQRH